jgi:DNA-binding transcriptional MerR regulator
MDIAEVAKRSGVPASTLRFYEEKGLIASVGRRGCAACSIAACWSAWR